MKIKRIAAALLASVMLIPTGIDAAEDNKMTEIFSDDFESYEIGSIPSNGWKATFGNSANGGIVEEDGHGKLFKMTDKSKNGAEGYLVYSMPKQTGTTIIQFDYRDSNENSYGGFGINGDGSKVISIECQPSSTDGGRGDHKFHYRYNAADGTAKIRKLTRVNWNQWYRFTFIINGRKALWSMYMDGEQMVADEPFVSKVSGVDEIKFYTSWWNANSCSVDNFKIYTGEPDEEALGIKIKKRSKAVSYGDMLIDEPKVRETEEDLLDWNPVYTMGGDVGVYEDKGDKYISVSGTQITKEFAKQTESVKLSFDFRETSAEAGTSVLIRNNLSPIVQLSLKKRGENAFLSNMDAEGITNDLGEAPINQWNHVEVNLDIKKSIFDVFLNGKQVGAGIECREKTDAVNIFGIYAGGSANKYAAQFKNITLTDKNVPKVNGEERHDNVFEPRPPKLTGMPTYDNFRAWLQTLRSTRMRMER